MTQVVVKDLGGTSVLEAAAARYVEQGDVVSVMLAGGANAQARALRRGSPYRLSVSGGYIVLPSEEGGEGEEVASAPLSDALAVLEGYNFSMGPSRTDPSRTAVFDNSLIFRLLE